MKTVDEIYEEMRTCFSDITGITTADGCDLAARLYAVAAQVYALYVQADWVRRQAFPQTAQGEALDQHAWMRGVERKAASAARGIVRFTAEADPENARTIPAGTVCMTREMTRFETTQDGVIPAGRTKAEIPVQAVQTGPEGNVPAGAIVSMAVAPVGVHSCTNLSACTGGMDEETDEALRERVLDTFRRLPNGANAAYYQQQALSFDTVVAANVLPRNRGAGTVDVVIATAVGVPDETLRNQVEAHLQQRRELAVDVQVLAPETVEVDVTVQIAHSPESTLAQTRTRVRTAVQSWFTGHRLGESVFLAELNSLVFQCDGVVNCALSSPEEDVEIQPDQLPVLGILTVEEFE